MFFLQIFSLNSSSRRRSQAGQKVTQQQDTKTGSAVSTLLSVAKWDRNIDAHWTKTMQLVLKWSIFNNESSRDQTSQDFAGNYIFTADTVYINVSLDRKVFYK